MNKHIIILLITAIFNIYSEESIPDYNKVFNQVELQTITIKIDNSEWLEMNENLEESYPAQDSRMGGAPAIGDRPAMGDRPPRDGGRPPMGERPPMGDNPNGNGPGGERPNGAPEPMNMGAENTNNVDIDPIWVKSEINFDNQVWENVGIRFKGNSSLRDAYYSGDLKKSFKLDFDKFDTEYPENVDRTFYGFEQLNLNNNFNDKSLMREKVAADLFREWGLVSAQTSFYEVIIDYGEGSKSLGIYTLVEEMDDTVIDTQLGDDSGNLYKPDGTGATFAINTFNEEEMDIRNPL